MLRDRWAVCAYGRKKDDLAESIVCIPGPAVNRLVIEQLLDGSSRI